MTDDREFADLTRRVERLERCADEHDDRLHEVERGEAVLDAAVAIARWLIAIAIPLAAVLIAVWKG
jgi:hypothetical protein